MAIRRLATRKSKQDVKHDARTSTARGLHASKVQDDPAEIKPKNVLLTIPAANLLRIEAAIKARSVRIPRHTWLLEAIVEKLEREERK